MAFGRDVKDLKVLQARLFSFYGQLIYHGGNDNDNNGKNGHNGNDNGNDGNYNGNDTGNNGNNINSQCQRQKRTYWPAYA